MALVSTPALPSMVILPLNENLIKSPTPSSQEGWQNEERNVENDKNDFMVCFVFKPCKGLPVSFQGLTI